MIPWGEAFSKIQSLGKFSGHTTDFFLKYIKRKEKRNIIYRLKEIKDMSIKSDLVHCLDLNLNKPIEK